MAFTNSRFSRTISALIVVYILCFAQSAFAGSIVGWGSIVVDSTQLETNDFVAIAAGEEHSLALKANGSIVGWGNNNYGQATPPDGNDFVAIAACGFHSLALRSDGSIIGWGWNYYGQATPPDGNDFVAIAAGYNHSLALKSDGSIIGWGGDWSGQVTPPDGNDFVAIAAGSGFHNLALRSDGSIVGWGWNYYGQATPPDGNDFTAISAGSDHSLALKSDGSIVAWGANYAGQASPPEGNDFVAISAGSHHNLALRSDGSIIAWGEILDFSESDQFIAEPPAGNDFVAIAAGSTHYLGLKSDGSIVGVSWGWDKNDNGEAIPPDGNDFVAIAAGGDYSVAIREAHSKYDGGTGKPNDPYQIAMADDLIALGETPEDYDKHFILTDDIDLNPNLPNGRIFNQAVIPDFRGVFNGSNHTIAHLSIEGEDNVGLFGTLSGHVKDLGVVDVNITGSGYSVGGLVGNFNGYISVWGARVTNCYSTGLVAGLRGVGGLVGSSCGHITGSYSTATVSGETQIGGLVGGTYETDIGLGFISGSIATSYSTGKVTGNTGVGGLVGNNTGSIAGCYSTGMVTGNENVGGFVGENWGSVNSSFWDMDTSNQTTSGGGMGLKTSEMQNPDTFMVAGWNFVDQSDGPQDIWVEPVSGGYPLLYWQVPPEFGLPVFAGGKGEPNDPYLISTEAQLNAIGDNPRLMESHFKLINNLDLQDCRFYVIGHPDNAYHGVFNGNGHTLSHLRIECETTCGVFPVLGDGGEITDLGIVDVNISSFASYVGGLVGSNSGSIRNCYTSGAVRRGYHDVGGLVGYNPGGSITRSYSTCMVTGRGRVGGLVGRNEGTITQSYSTGLPSGDFRVGGLVGENGGDVINCFWDIQASIWGLSYGGTGKTTAQMQTASTFLDAGWDFVDETENGTDDIWWIDEGNDYPRLWWEAQ